MRLACEYTCGQPYLVNAPARWCVEKIHRDDDSAPITAADMHEAKEKIAHEDRVVDGKPIHVFFC